MICLSCIDDNEERNGSLFELADNSQLKILESILVFPALAMT